MRRAAILLALLLAAGLAGTALWFRGRGKPAVDPTATTAEARRPPRRPPGPRDPATVPAALRDTSWRIRLATANALRTMNALSVPRRAGLVAELIDREAAAPVSAPPFAGSYLPLTSTLLIQYLSLLEVFGHSSTAAVKAAPAPTSAAGREWRTLAVAATGARESAPQVRALLGSADPAVRMTAARYLGGLRDRDAIPALRQAMADPFTARTHSDGSGDAPAAFHPVREQAARSLRLLGRGP